MQLDRHGSAAGRQQIELTITHGHWRSVMKNFTPPIVVPIALFIIVVIVALVRHA
jgi:hypothetical protein